MKFLKLALVAAAASVAMGGAAMAEELKLSYNVGVASDYVFRGVSQTQEDPQVFGGIDATYGIGYAGVWASNVDFGADDPTAEIDFYAGVKPTVGDTALDLGVIYYSYIDDKGLTPGSPTATSKSRPPPRVRSVRPPSVWPSITRRNSLARPVKPCTTKPMARSRSWTS
jgi:uncharacterized protein (TIGR02001 family)